MIVRMPFLPAHLESVAARAAELERLAEDAQDPLAYVRAARLYTIAARIADDIGGRGRDLFTRTDLARVRDELRVLATDAATAGARAGGRESAIRAGDARERMTGGFREIALRIEQRLLDE